MSLIASEDRSGAQPAKPGFVQIEGVAKHFGETLAVQHVDLAIAQRELFALLGSSGCGKSTLLRMLAGFETVSAGRILLDGEDITHVPPYRRPVNMMFQSYALFPHMTVQDNVGFGLRQEGVARAEIGDRVAEALKLVQMQAFGKRRPSQLSGGQQQRVALARSLVKQPKLLLLDEPMSALDKQIRQKTQIELSRIVEQVGVTCIMVTHDQEEAMTMADRLAVMSEGRIVQCGTPQDVYEHPNSRFVASFIGSTNLFDGVIVEDAADHIVIETPAFGQKLYVNHGVSATLGTAVTASIRPERVMLSRQRPVRHTNWAEGEVAHAAYMGSHTVFQVRLPSGSLIEASLPSRALAEGDGAALGESVFVSWSAEGVTLLSA